MGCDLPALVARLASPDVSERLTVLVAMPRRTADEYAELLAKVSQIGGLFHRLFGGLRLDAVAFPTVPVTAPLVGATTVQLPSGERDVFEAVTATETPASLAGIPALTVPAGQDHDGMPFALELDGPAGTDRRLIAIGATLATLLRATANPGGNPTR